MKPTVSVVLGSYNRLFFLKQAIRSIRESEAPFGYEIIVVDGGSTDGSVRWLTRQKDIVTIVQHNRGEWQGRSIERRSWGYFMNLAFKAAAGKYLLMMSDDSVLTPEAMARGVAHAQQQERHGKKVGAVPFYWRNWPEEEKYFVIATNGQPYLNHGLYLRKAVHDSGWINEEDYFFYTADVDLCFRLLEAGYSIDPAPHALVEHYNHANLGVRASNEEHHRKDTAALVRNWPEFYGDRDPATLGSLQYTEATYDPAFARKRFGLLHFGVQCKRFARRVMCWLSRKAKDCRFKGAEGKGDA